MNRVLKFGRRLRGFAAVVIGLVKYYRSGTNTYIQKPGDPQKFQDTVRTFGTYWLCVNQPPPTAVFLDCEPGAQP